MYAALDRPIGPSSIYLRAADLPTKRDSCKVPRLAPRPPSAAGRKNSIPHGDANDEENLVDAVVGSPDVRCRFKLERPHGASSPGLRKSLRGNVRQGPEGRP